MRLVTLLGLNIVGCKLIQSVGLKFSLNETWHLVSFASEVIYLKLLEDEFEVKLSILKHWSHNCESVLIGDALRVEQEVFHFLVLF